MTLRKDCPESAQWLPAERLGQFNVDSRVRPWLIGNGLLTRRMKAVCGEHVSALRSADNAGLFRDVELSNGGDVWVLAELGDSALCETLDDLSGVERASYEYAWLPAEEAVTARALRDAELRPEGLWARRSRVTLRKAPLLMQELFLPAAGRA